MSKKYYSLNELLREEMEYYSLYLTEIIYSDDQVINEDVIEEEINIDQIVTADDNLEELYDGLIKYVNVKTDKKFKYNNNSITSLMCKKMIMAHYYEYITLYFDKIDDVNKQIYIRLCNDLSNKNIISLFDTYSRDIIEMYDYILTIHHNFPDLVNKIRQNIIDLNLLNDVIKINYMSIFDYRFLMGYKFNNEDIHSVSAGNNLLKIVNKINIGNLSQNTLLAQIQQMLEYDEEIAQYINDHKAYMISNIYEQIIRKKEKNEEEQKFISFIEYSDIDYVLDSINIIEKSLGQCLYMFYVMNKNGITEERRKNLIDNTKKEKKYYLLKKYNPYYLEDEQYFKNRRNNCG